MDKCPICDGEAGVYNLALPTLKIEHELRFDNNGTMTCKDSICVIQYSKVCESCCRNLDRLLKGG